MNTLSWFLYFADIIPSLGIVCFGVALLLFAGAALIGGMALDSNDDDVPPQFWKYWRRTVVGVVVLLLIAVATPSKNTLYAIAASELGEQVLDSPTGQRVKQALEAWIEQQLPKQAK